MGGEAYQKEEAKKRKERFQLMMKKRRKGKELKGMNKMEMDGVNKYEKIKLVGMRARQIRASSAVYREVKR